MDLANDQTRGPGGWLERYRFSRQERIADSTEPNALLRTAAYRCGRIMTQDGRLVHVQGRWWPYQGNWLRVLVDQHWGTGRGDWCQLYYHQPLGGRQFLSLSYVHTGEDASLSTLYVAMLALDQIASLRGSLALVCHVTNGRISDRLMQRWGWQSHCLHWRGRHFIKRFYGHYPTISPHWRSRLQIDNEAPASS
jgi:hypothetical protein